MRSNRMHRDYIHSVIQARLSNVSWIGGGSGGGKSTIATDLAERYGLRIYSTDDVMADHVSRCTTQTAPLLQKFMEMDMDERWLNRTPAVMLDTFHWFEGEAFDLIIEDLLDLPKSSGVVVEGFRPMPHLVAPYLKDPHQAVWLIPTPNFRRAAFDSRGTMWDIPRRTSNPERALRNLLERDRMFTDRVRDDARRLRLQTIEVDTTMTRADLADRVARFLQL